MDWLTKILFFEDLGADATVDWAPKLPHAAGVAALAFVAAAIALFAWTRFLYLRREPDYVRPRRKRLLAALRTAGLVGVLFMATGAYLAVTRRSVSKGTVALLIDRSASMGIAEHRVEEADVRAAAGLLGLAGRPLTPDDLQRINRTPRIDLVKAALGRRDAALLKQLAAGAELKAFTFGQAPGVLPLGIDAGEALADLPDASDQATRLGDALRDVARRLRGQQVTAVVALTDGAVNRGEDAVQVAGELGFPVHTVGVGLPDARDVSLRFLFMEDVIFRGDRFPIDVRIRQKGFEGRQTRLVVRRNGEVVHSETVVLDRRSEMQHTIELKADKAGVFTYEVQLEELPGETTAGNNVRRRHGVRVVDEPLKVLVVDDKPRYEWRFLKTALEADPKRIRPAFVLRAADRRLVQQSPDLLLKFPADGKELQSYDLVILGNVPASFFTRQELANVEQYVRVHGGWVVVVAGERHMPDSYVGTPVADLLPVEVAFGAAGQGAAASRIPTSGVQPALTPAGLASPLLNLDADAEQNKRLWRDVPPIFWLHGPAAIKPGAEVLAEAPLGAGEAAPLIVHQRYGAGQVLYVATDETWRLRKLPGGQHHRRLWGQIATQMGLEHMLGGTRRIQIETDTGEAALGADLTVLARVKGADDEPLAAEAVTVVARDDDGKEAKIPLPAEAGRKGVFSGKWTPPALGRYRLTVENRADEGEAVVSVVAPQIELEDPGLREDLLRRIADATGGRYVPLHEIGVLGEQLAKTPPLVKTRRQEKALWNTPAVLFLIAVLFGLEWFLRKRWDLL